MIRTHNDGELTSKDVGKTVTLCGWIASRRDHGEIIFMDLRDCYGVTQIVFDPEKNKLAHDKAHSLKNEYCVKVDGRVCARPSGTTNPKIATGEIEIEVSSVTVFSESDALPFEIKDDVEASEEVRLKYRYLDLRRFSMQNKLKLRHKAYRFITNFLDKEDFVFIETPMLTKSTPEGARDYLVPSRLAQGNFYALPQSPQIFKQLLMVSGLERYFQITRCFRDEDLRADRQPEFVQLDIEMSFIDEKDIMELCERLFKGLFEEVVGQPLEIPFQVMDYDDAIMKYGTDKPDTRFEMLLSDFTKDIGGCEFKIFRETLESGGVVMGLAAPGCGSKSRKEIDEYTAFVGEYGAKGLAYFKVEGNTLVSPIAKFFSKEILTQFREKTGAKEGDMIFMVADSRSVAAGALGALRLRIAREGNLIDQKKFCFLWVINFPLFKFDVDENKWVSEHHPFTSFVEADAEFIEKKEFSKVRSRSYDLVLNGSEIGSGSIRIHRRDMQKKVFSLLGLSDEELEKKFGFLLDAFRYGAPPHGGVAFGMDRLITLFTGDASIREVIPFPKTQKGVCPLTLAPSSVSEEQLRELGLKLRESKSQRVKES